MKKKILISCIIGTILITCQLSNFFSFHRIPDNSLLPTIDSGKIVIISSIVNYSYGDFVFCRTSSNSKFYGRVAAIEGDTVEYKEGYILCNGFIIDHPETILLSYFTRKPINDSTKFNWLSLPPERHSDTTVFCLSFSEFKEVSRHYLLKNYFPSQVFQNKFEVIPQGHCLVAADNRSIYNKEKPFKITPIESIKRVIPLTSNQ